MKFTNISNLTAHGAAIAAGLALVLAPQAALAQGASSVDGVWKITGVATTGAGPPSNASPQPSLVILARGYYSYISVNSTAPRPVTPPAKDPAKLTDAEKLARYEEWSPFTANSGSYEVKGATLVRHLIVAKNASVVGTTTTTEFKLTGDTLVLISKSAAGQPAGETRTTLTRVR